MMNPDSISDAYRNSWTLFVYYGLRVAILIAAGVFSYEKDWASVAGTLAVFVLMSVPSALKYRYRFYMPFAIDFGIAVLIFVTLFLGELANFYNYIPLWDKFVHFQSGLIFGSTGFVLVYTLNKQKYIHLDISPGFVAFFAVTFSLAIGVAWEVIEFAFDTLLGLTMQHGNSDTMWDLIADGMGAMIVSVIGYFWMHRQARLPFTPRLFRFFGKRYRKII